MAGDSFRGVIKEERAPEALATSRVAGHADTWGRRVPDLLTPGK